MKINKSQLRRIIAEERAKLMEQPISGEQARQMSAGSDSDPIIGEIPSELEEQLAMEMQYYFQEALEAEEFDGTGDTWNDEIMRASNAFYQGIIDSGALKSILELWSDVETGLHNGDYYQ